MRVAPGDPHHFDRAYQLSLYVDGEWRFVEYRPAPTEVREGIVGRDSEEAQDLVARDFLRERARIPARSAGGDWVDLLADSLPLAPPPGEGPLVRARATRANPLVVAGVTQVVVGIVAIIAGAVIVQKANQRVDAHQCDVPECTAGGFLVAFAGGIASLSGMGIALGGLRLSPERATDSDYPRLAPAPAIDLP